MNPTRLLVLAYKPDFFLEEFYKLLQSDARWRTRVVFVTSSSPARPYEVVASGFEYQTLPAGLLQGLRFLSSEIRPGRAEVVLVFGHSPSILWLAGWMAILRGIPVLYFADTNSLAERRRPWWRRRLKRLFLRPYYRRLRGLLAASTLTADFFRETTDNGAGVVSFPYVIDNDRQSRETDFFRARRSETLRELGLPTDRPVLLFVGRLVRQKGLHVLLTACARLKDKFEFSLVVVGDGPERAPLAALSRRLRLDDRVRYAGWVATNGTARCFGAADVFVLPSLEEPWAIVVNEAMASGLPVIATRCTGAGRDLVEHGVNGFTVEEGDAEQLAEHLERLLSDAGLRAAMGRHSRERIQAWNYQSALGRLARAVSDCLPSGGAAESAG